MPLVGAVSDGVRVANDIYTFQSGFVTSKCWHQQEAKVQMHDCNAFGNPDKWRVNCNGLGCSIEQDNTLTFVFEDTDDNSVSTPPINQPQNRAVIDRAKDSDGVVDFNKFGIPPVWATVEPHAWLIVKSDTFPAGYRVHLANDTSQCATIADSSTNPPDGTPLFVQSCIDGGSAGPQDFLLF